MADRHSFPTAADVKGDKVTNAHGEHLGEIRDLVMDESAGRVAYAVLGFGGFLGFGEKLVAVPWNALRPSTREHEFMMDLSKDRLREAPTLHRDNWPDGGDHAYLAGLYSHYGLEPDWDDETPASVTAGEAARAGIGEAGHRERDELSAGMAWCDTGVDRNADPAEASGVRHDASAGDVSGGAMPRTWNRQDAGGMSDTDMDVRTPGGNIRPPDIRDGESVVRDEPEVRLDSPGRNVPVENKEAEGDSGSLYPPRMGGDADRTSNEAYPDRLDADRAGPARATGPDYPFHEGGSSGGVDEFTDAVAEESRPVSRDAGLSTGGSSALGITSPMGSFRGTGSSLSGTGGGATGLGHLGGKGPSGTDLPPTSGYVGRSPRSEAAGGGGAATGNVWGDEPDLPARHASRDEEGGSGSFHTTSEPGDHYSDTSGVDDAGETDRMPESRGTEPQSATLGEPPEGAGDTRAFEMGEDLSAVSGYGSSHDIVNMSGASGPSSRDMTGGSEGLSAAEDLTIGSVDDLDTAGSTLGLSDESVADEIREEDSWTGGITSTDISSAIRGDEEGQEHDPGSTGAAGSGRGHSSGEMRTTRRGSSSEEEDEDRNPS